MDNLNQKIAKGAFWMLIVRWVESSIGFISLTILARLLIPEDFGLVAMAMPIVAFMELLTAFGFDWALIQKKDVNESHYNTAWTFNVILRVTSMLVLMALAIPSSSFFNEPRLVGVILILAISCGIQGFQNIGTVAFRKDFTFHKEFYLRISRKFSAFAVTTTIAFLYQSYWALILGTLVGTVVWVSFGFMLHPFRPRFCLAARSDLFNFSKWLMIGNFIAFFNLKGVFLLIGKLAGSTALGIYTVSAEIAQQITVYIVSPINTAVFSGYAKESDNLKNLANVFVRVNSMISIIFLPASAGLFLVTPDLVQVWLGAKWIEAVPVIRILVINGTFFALLSNNNYVRLALGKPKINTMLAFFYMVMLLPIMFVFTKSYGIQGAAWSFLIPTLIITPVNFFLLFRELQLKVGRYLKAIWRPALSTFIMAVGVNYGTSFIAPEASSHMFRLFAGVFIGTLAYTFAIMIFWIFRGSQ